MISDEAREGAILDQAEHDIDRGVFDSTAIHEVLQGRAGVLNVHKIREKLKTAMMVAKAAGTLK